MSANNTKLISIVVPVEEDKCFDDVPNLENGIVDKNIIRVPEFKGILKKTNYDIENDDKMKSIIGHLIAILIVVILVSPFVICDLVFGYTDDSCVDIYPENMGFMNMKIYLLVSGYLVIGLLLCIITNLSFVAKDNTGDNIVLVAFLSIVIHISQVFFVIWNILGAVIFWGTLNKRNLCSKSINTYLFVSLIIKLVVNFYNIMSTNNKKEK
jgi:hypothetical protein